MTTANRVIKNTGFLYAKMGITMFISLYTTRLILNALGAEDFGVFNIVGGAIAMLGFLNAAMASATQRFMSFAEGEGDVDNQKSIFNISIILHLVIASIMGILLLMAGWFFFNGILNIAQERIFAAKVVYGSLIVSTIFTVMTVPYDAVLNAHENMFYYSIVGIIESVLKLIVAVLIVGYGGDKLILYGVLMAFIPIITMTIMRLYCHRNYIECVISPKQYFDYSLMKKMNSFAAWSLLGSISGVFFNYGRSIVANHFFGTIINATTGIVAQLNGQLLSFSNNLLKAVNPIIVKEEGNGNRESMYKTTFAVSKFSFLIYAIFAIPFYTNISLILKLWLENPPPYSEIFFKIFIFQVLVEQLTSPLLTVLSAVGRIKEYSIISSIIMLLSIITIVILFSNGYPPYYLMVVSLINAIILTFFKIFYCKRYSDLPLKPYFIIVVSKSVIVATLGFIMSSWFKIILNDGLWSVIMASIITIVLILFISYFVLLTNQEKNYILNILKKKTLNEEDSTFF